MSRGKTPPWRIANAGFRLLVEEAQSMDPPDEVMSLIVRGQMYGHLDLTHMEAGVRVVVSTVLAEGARRVRHRLAAVVPATQWEIAVIERLAILEMLMEGLADAD